MFKLIEVIISDSKVFINSLKYNLPTNLNVETHILPTNFTRESIAHLNKIDLLIIDDKCDNFVYLKDRCKNIIHLSGSCNDQHAVTFIKPFLLINLLQLITSYYECNYIFCLINDQFLYNQKLAYVLTPHSKIKLTTKENEIFHKLILSADNIVTFDQLLNEIWQYHPDCDSNTIINHLYKLKSKLQSDLLQINGKFTKLNIKSLK